MNIRRLLHAEDNVAFGRTRTDGSFKLRRLQALLANAFTYSWPHKPACGIRLSCRPLSVVVFMRAA